MLEARELRPVRCDVEALVVVLPATLIDTIPGILVDKLVQHDAPTIVTAFAP